MNKVIVGFLAVFVCGGSSSEMTPGGGSSSEMTLGGGSSSEMTPEGMALRDHINLATEALCATGIERGTLNAAQSVRGARVKDWSLSVECEQEPPLEVCISPIQGGKRQDVRGDETCLPIDAAPRSRG